MSPCLREREANLKGKKNTLEKAQSQNALRPWVQFLVKKKNQPEAGELAQKVKHFPQA